LENSDFDNEDYNAKAMYITFLWLNTLFMYVMWCRFLK